MPVFNFKNPFGKADQTLAELQEEDERLEAELSVLQKRQLREKLSASGLTVKKDFAGSLKRAWSWFKTH